MHSASIAQDYIVVENLGSGHICVEIANLSHMMIYSVLDLKLC